MIKDKSRLAFKLFIMVWIMLTIHVTLKLTFNYWQPYVIPNDTLQSISDFIDSNEWLKITLNGLFYVFNGYIVICCCLQKWQLGKKKNIITLILLITGYFFGILIDRTIGTLIVTIIYPLISNYKKWLYVILTFIFSNVFLFISLFLEGFVTANDMNYVVRMFLQFDYYIMLILNYFIFNLIRKKE